MSNEMCLVTIADIYGEEWWERNKAELERDWEWSFGVANGEETVASIFACGLVPIFSNGPYIILHRRKPKTPTLREVYGVDEVTIPAGWEWTGEWRRPIRDDHFQSGGGGGCAVYAQRCHLAEWDGPRLILRERPKKVWFKAEEKERESKAGDWFHDGGSWHYNKSGCVIGTYLCATRHEEVDQTVQVVTQADVDKVGGR